MRSVYESHVAEKFFIYGSPAQSFGEVDSHPAFLELLALRRLKGDALSTITFIADGATLPTYYVVPACRRGRRGGVGHAWACAG